MHGTRRQKRQITPFSEWHTRPFCTALSRSRAQHNELNQNESRGGSRKLIRFGFPIGKKTSIENRDMDQWRRERTGVCVRLTVIVIPTSIRSRAVILPPHRFLFLRHPQMDGGRGERERHREGEDPLQPQLCYSLRELYVALKARKDKPKNLAAQPLHPTVHALRDGP